MRFAATLPMFALCLSASCVLRTPTLSSSIGASVPVPVPSGPPSSSGEEVAAGGVIDAGCTFKGNEIKGEPGEPRQLTCPGGCPKDAYIYGTDVYSTDSPVCAAAMHAGVMSNRGGEVTIVLEPGRPAYRGSKRYGITSRDWGEYRGSFRFEGPRVAQAAPEVKAPVVVDAGCSLEGRALTGEPGSILRVSCPSGCKSEHAAFGTETYAGHSRICVAAIHAGLSSEEGGGEFTLILGDKRLAFRGSKRNGIQTDDWGDFNTSFQLKR